MALTKVSTGMLSADVASIDLNIDANTMYIDVSSNRVGINNATPSTALDVTGTVTADGLTVDGNPVISGTSPQLFLQTGASNTNWQIAAQENVANAFEISSGAADASAPDDTYTKRLVVQNNGNLSLYEDTGTTPKFFWDASAESLGIGTASPLSLLDIRSVNPKLTISSTLGGTFSGATTIGELAFHTRDGSGIGARDIAFIQAESTVTGTTPSGELVFGVSASNTAAFEAMRLDAAGNLLVGKTALEYDTTAGHIFRADGFQSSSRSAGNVADFNRLTSEGEIIRLSKGGTTVGSISAGALSGGVNPIAIGHSTSGLWFIPAAGAIAPFNMSTNTGSDNAIDFGYSSLRWDDIYATNGTIQTSDRNEKQDIEALTDAEQRVAVATKGLLRKFRWKSSVAEKGDDARIHFGIIAQDLQAAFAAEGLDAGDYAMFINSTWTDEETGEERSRMGVRYSELLAFIIAAI